MNKHLYDDIEDWAKYANVSKITERDRIIWSMARLETITDTDNENKEAE